MTNAMYREQILEHYKHPLNQGTLEKPDARHHDLNPLCGDEIEVFLKIENKKEKNGKGKRDESGKTKPNDAGNAIIADIKFTSQGCAISTAAASLLTESVKGKTLDEVKALTRDDVFALLGVPVSAARVKCALLSLKAIKSAAYAYLGEKLDEKRD
ncbi:iron-sulfur cluster assembly scaffold protein [Candidatus Micrarchaeota archaeon]|nr:iron-sulfur cluster assembly scaffold protein [Candidatus Micrarchaeota archaeon]